LKDEKDGSTSKKEGSTRHERTEGSAPRKDYNGRKEGRIHTIRKQRKEAKAGRKGGRKRSADGRKGGRKQGRKNRRKDGRTEGTDGNGNNGRTAGLL
jgi:hypothetical protein